MWALRGPDAVEPALAGPQHRPAGHADHPHVEGPDGGGVAGHLHVGQAGAARRAPRRRWSTCRPPRARCPPPTGVWRSTPATDAAGPEYSARAGSRRSPAGSVAPPSPRMTMTGASMPAAATPRSTCSSVRTAIGQHRRVQRGGDRPQLEAVEAGHLRRPAGREPAGEGQLHGPALVARRRRGRTPRPRRSSWRRPRRAGRGPRRAAASSRPRVTSRNSCTVGSRRPGASSTLSSRVRLAALRRSGWRPRPSTPTTATSPSRRAFTAWVVE